MPSVRRLHAVRTHLGAAPTSAAHALPATGATVCVTSAAGYVGSWLVKKLLERGHAVRACVRNVDDDAKTGFLKAMPGYASGKRRTRPAVAPGLADAWGFARCVDRPPSDLRGGVVGEGLRPRCAPLSRLWRTTAPDRRAYRSHIDSALSARRRATDPAAAA